MLYAGQMKLNGAIWSLDEYGALFDTLKHQMSYSDGHSRYVGFEAVSNGECVARFLGAEISENQCLPLGYVLLELSEDQLIVHDQDGIRYHSDINWTWKTEHYGEFQSYCMPGLISGQEPAKCNWQLTSIAEFDVNQDYDDDVELVDYDANWVNLFKNKSDELRRLLGSDIALRIEHYGSTSIPGMTAKPIVDILVEVPDFEAAHQHAISKLCGPTCEYWQYSNHMTFIVRNSPNGKRNFHIHMAPKGHPLWDGMAFRDYLRTHDDEALQYAELKRQLAQGYASDRERYTLAKSEFVSNITRKARGCE